MFYHCSNSAILLGLEGLNYELTSPIALVSSGFSPISGEIDFGGLAANIGQTYTCFGNASCRYPIEVCMTYQQFNFQSFENSVNAFKDKVKKFEKFEAKVSFRQEIVNLARYVQINNLDEPARNFQQKLKSLLEQEIGIYKLIEKLHNKEIVPTPEGREYIENNYTYETPEDLDYDETMRKKLIENYKHADTTLMQNANPKDHKEYKQDQSMSKITTLDIARYPINTIFDYILGKPTEENAPDMIKTALESLQHYKTALSNIKQKYKDLASKANDLGSFPILFVSNRAKYLKKIQGEYRATKALNIFNDIDYIVVQKDNEKTKVKSHIPGYENILVVNNIQNDDDLDQAIKDHESKLNM